MKYRALVYTICFLFTCEVFALSKSDAAYADYVSDYEVKAGLIYALVPKVRWLDKTPQKPTSPNICTIGLDSVYKVLKNIIKKENSSYAITNKGLKSSFRDCHILYISSSEQARVSDILKETNRMGVLTISGIQGFAEMGGMIEFMNDGKGVALKINTRPTKESHIDLDIDLLGYSTTIHK